MKSSRQVSQAAWSGLYAFGQVSAALITSSASLSPATVGSPATQRPKRPVCASRLDETSVAIGPTSTEPELILKR